MSSIAAGANSERTNRWLLIGAAALAVLAGVLIFLVLANSGGSDNKTTKVSGGNSTVLVAKNTIAASTKLTADMFDSVSVPQSILVVNPVSDATAIAGQVTRTQILKGQQVSFDALGRSLGTQENQLAFSITEGMRGFSVPVSAAQLVSGFVVPDDRVDVVMTYSEKRGDQDVTRVETVLENVRVIGVATNPVVNQPTLNAQGTPIAKDPSQTLGMRPEDAKPDPSAGTATLELKPADVELLTAAMAKGTLSLTLRGVGDDTATKPVPYFQDQFGPVQLPPRP